MTIMEYKYYVIDNLSYESKEGEKDQESTQSSTTPYRKVKKHKGTSHTREPRSQPFPAGYHNGARTYMTIINTNMNYN